MNRRKRWRWVRFLWYRSWVWK